VPLLLFVSVIRVMMNETKTKYASAQLVQYRYSV